MGILVVELNRLWLSYQHKGSIRTQEEVPVWKSLLILQQVWMVLLALRSMSVYFISLMHAACSVLNSVFHFLLYNVSNLYVGVIIPFHFTVKITHTLGHRSNPIMEISLSLKFALLTSICQIQKKLNQWPARWLHG